MEDRSRRDFLRGIAGVGASAVVGGQLYAGEEVSEPAQGSDIVSLGNTDLKPTRLGIGTGTKGGSVQRQLGTEGLTRLVRYSLERGIRYIDTADNYGIHTRLRKALKGIPRDQYFLQTKTPSRDPDEVRSDIERYRQELGTSQLDTVLMHCMRDGDWPRKMRPVMDVLLDEKEKGHIGAVGVSCHGWEPFVAAGECPNLDVHLVRINPYQAIMDGPPEDVARQMRKMHQKGRGVIGMKVFGESGYDSRRKRLKSLKFVEQLDSVDCYTIGFSNTDEIDETLELIEQASHERTQA